jgi:N4-gp56 family major capsid protein
MVDNVYGVTDRKTGDSSHGQNTVVHYYDKAGVKAANEIAVYAQFADRRSMPLKMGTTYKVSKWLHIYDRLLDPNNQHGGTDPEFAAKGYLTARNIADVSAGLANDAALTEGAGAVNKRSIKKVTIETNFSRYGEMIDFTDEVDMFAEDAVQVRYREELGMLANRRAEDLIQLDMLTTTTAMYVGTATSLLTVGTELSSTDVADRDGTNDGQVQVNYDLIRKAVRKLVRNRAEKNTSIVTGSTKIDTRTVNKAFYAIIGPEVKYDLENLTRGSSYETEFVYIPAYKYADASNLAEGEVGAMNDVRFIESESQVVYAGAGALIPHSTTIGTDGEYTGLLSYTVHDAASAAALNTFTGGSDYADGEARFDVFPILFPTKGAFATVGLKGHGKIKFNSKSPKKVELSNPYGTQGFFSYNMWYAGIILREERLMKILVAASA